LAIWRNVACWISKAMRAQAHARTFAPTHAWAHAGKRTYPRARAHTHIAFPQQQWLRERTWVLRYTYIACLVCLFLGDFEECRKTTLGFIYFFASKWKNLSPTERILKKCDIWAFFFFKYVEIFKFVYNLRKITAILHKDLCRFIASCWISS
jgi:hypothetical protein